MLLVLGYGEDQLDCSSAVDHEGSTWPASLRFLGTTSLSTYGMISKTKGPSRKSKTTVWPDPRPNKNHHEPVPRGGPRGLSQKMNNPVLILGLMLTVRT